MGSLLSQQKSSEAQLMFTYSMNEFIQFNFICMARNANNSCDNRKKTTTNYQTLGLSNTRFRTVWRKVGLMFFPSWILLLFYMLVCLVFLGVFLAFLFNFLFFYSRLTRMPPGCLQAEVFQVYPIRRQPVHAFEMYGNVLVFLPTPQQRLIQSFIMKINIHMWKSLEMPWYLSCVLSVNLLSSVKKMGLQWWTC